MAIHSKRQSGREFTVVLERNGERCAFKGYSPRSVTLYRQASFSGAMRKYSGWRIERKDGERAMLDSCAHRPVIYGSVTVLRRRRA